MLYFIFLGIGVAGLIHLILYSFDYYNSKYHDDPLYPDFSSE